MLDELALGKVHNWQINTFTPSRQGSNDEGILQVMEKLAVWR